MSNDIGLPNIGNSCYLNALMQMLYSVPEFVTDVLQEQTNDSVFKSLQYIFKILDKKTPITRDEPDFKNNVNNIIFNVFNEHPDLFNIYKIIKCKNDDYLDILYNFDIIGILQNIINEYDIICTNLSKIELDFTVNSNEKLVSLKTKLKVKLDEELLSLQTKLKSEIINNNQISNFYFDTNGDVFRIQVRKNISYSEILNIKFKDIKISTSKNEDELRIFNSLIDQKFTNLDIIKEIIDENKCFIDYNYDIKYLNLGIKYLFKNESNENCLNIIKNIKSMSNYLKYDLNKIVNIIDNIGKNILFIFVNNIQSKFTKYIIEDLKNNINYIKFKIDVYNEINKFLKTYEANYTYNNIIMDLTKLYKKYTEEWQSNILCLINSIIKNDFTTIYENINKDFTKKITDIQQLKELLKIENRNECDYILINHNLEKINNKYLILKNYDLFIGKLNNINKLYSDYNINDEPNIDPKIKLIYENIKRTSIPSSITFDVIKENNHIGTQEDSSELFNKFCTYNMLFYTYIIKHFCIESTNNLSNEELNYKNNTCDISSKLELKLKDTSDKYPYKLQSLITDYYENTTEVDYTIESKLRKCSQKIIRFNTKKYLLISLSRLVQESKKPRRIIDKITNIDKITIFKTDFNLIGAVIHRGFATGGHYIYIKKRSNNQYMVYNDNDTVCEFKNLSELQDAYILLYKRCQ